MSLRLVVFLSMLSVCLQAAELEYPQHKTEVATAFESRGLQLAELPAHEVLKHGRSVKHSWPNAVAGLWLMLAAVALAVILSLLTFRAHKIHALKLSDRVRNKDLYDLVFGARRAKSHSSQVFKECQSFVSDKNGFEEPIELDDTLSLARQLLAQHKYQQALEYLLMQLQFNPERTDWRLCVLKIYAFRKEWGLFSEQMEILEMTAGSELIREARKLYPNRSIQA